MQFAIIRFRMSDFTDDDGIIIPEKSGSELKTGQQKVKFFAG